MRATRPHWVEHWSQRKVESDVVLMAADDTEEVESEFSQIEVLD